MHGQRVLVTGGAGFIGSNLANHLATENTVIAIDDGHLGTPTHLDDGVEFHERSVLDAGLPVEDVDVVYHLAAYSSYTMVEDAKQAATRVNVEGFVNVVEQARQAGCRQIVYASTSSIYGSQTDPSAESMPVTVRTAYEASKRAREVYAEYFGAHYDLALAGMRFFSVYQGYGGAEGHKGEYANTVAQFADAIAAGERPEVFGDGTQTRDFTHVDDVVAALELTAEAGLAGIFNVGTGVATSFNAMIAMINEALDREIDPVYVANPLPVYVHDTCADASKLQAATGWQPEVDFAEGVRRVCAAYQ
jgi:Nucleoside-diphosphate-sugar epimerases